MTLVKFNDQKRANGYSTFNELFDSFFTDGYLTHKPSDYSANDLYHSSYNVDNQCDLLYLNQH